MKLKTLLALNLVAMFAVLAVVAGPPAYAKARALITGADIQDSSLTGADVQNGSLTRADLAGSVGASPKTVARFASNGRTGSGQVYATAKCLAGEYLVNGGVEFSAADTGDGDLGTSEPVDDTADGVPDGWLARGWITKEGYPLSIFVTAYCAPIIP